MSLTLLSPAVTRTSCHGNHSSYADQVHPAPIVLANQEAMGCSGGCLGFPKPHGNPRSLLGHCRGQCSQTLHRSQVLVVWVLTSAAVAPWTGSTGLLSLELLLPGDSSETLGSSGDISPAFLGRMLWFSSHISLSSPCFGKRLSNLMQKK